MFAVQVDDELSLRLFEERDAERLFQLIEANRDWLRRWLSFEAQTKSPDDSLAFIRRTREAYAATGRFWAAVLHQGRLVGAVGIASLDMQNRFAELGFWLARDATGRGLMTRACRAMLDHLFGTLGVNRVEIRSAADNAASIAVALRLGFKPEGTLRQAEFMRGSFRNVAVYGLLASEWSGRGDATEPLEDDPEYAHLRAIIEGEGLGAWRKISEESRAGFQVELMKEIGPGHPLWELPLTALGMRIDNRKEILCMINDGSQRVAVVHLTWSGKAESARLPKTQFYRSFERFIMEVMQDDYFIPGT